MREIAHIPGRQEGGREGGSLGYARFMAVLFTTVSRLMTRGVGFELYLDFWRLLSCGMVLWITGFMYFKHFQCRSFLAAPLVTPTSPFLSTLQHVFA